MQLIKATYLLTDTEEERNRHRGLAHYNSALQVDVLRRSSTPVNAGFCVVMSYAESSSVVFL